MEREIVAYIDAFWTWLATQYWPQLPLKLMDYLVFVVIVGGFFRLYSGRDVRRARYEQAKRLRAVHLEFLGGVRQIISALRTDEEEYARARDALGGVFARIETQGSQLVPYLREERTDTKLTDYIERARKLYYALWIKITDGIKDENGNLVLANMQRVVEANRLGGLYAGGANPVSDLCASARVLLLSCGYKQWQFFRHDLVGAKPAKTIDDDARSLKKAIEDASGYAYAPTPVTTNSGATSPLTRAA